MLFVDRQARHTIIIHYCWYYNTCIMLTHICEVNKTRNECALHTEKMEPSEIARLGTE